MSGCVWTCLMDGLLLPRPHGKRSLRRWEPCKGESLKGGRKYEPLAHDSGRRAGIGKPHKNEVAVYQREYSQPPKLRQEGTMSGEILCVRCGCAMKRGEYKYVLPEDTKTCSFPNWKSEPIHRYPQKCSPAQIAFGPQAAPQDYRIANRPDNSDWHGVAPWFDQAAQRMQSSQPPYQEPPRA